MKMTMDQTPRPEGSVPLYKRKNRSSSGASRKTLTTHSRKSSLARSISSQHNQITPPQTPNSSRGSINSNEMPQSPTSTNASDSSPIFLRAFYTYHPTFTTNSSTVTLPLNVGDVVLIHNVHSNGWADGTMLSSGARGWLPTNYCEHYDSEQIEPLLIACVQLFEECRGAVTNGFARASQEVVAEVVSGVRALLESTDCLTRDSPNVQASDVVRKTRKVLLSELSALVKISKKIPDLAGRGRCLQYATDELMDSMILSTFKTVVRGVKFLDAWIEVHYEPLEDEEEEDEDMLLDEEAMTNNEEEYSPSTPPTESVDYVAPLQTPTDSNFEEGVSATPHALDIYGHHISLSLSDDSCSPLLTFTAPDMASSTCSLDRYSDSSYHVSSTSLEMQQEQPLTALARLNYAHDALLSYLGVYIGELHLQSRSSAHILKTTKDTVTAAKELLAIVEYVYVRDARAVALESAKLSMYTRINDLIAAAREAVAPDENCEGMEIISADKGEALVEAATSCVRGAGDVVAKAKFVIERIGDFEVDLSRNPALEIGVGLTTEAVGDSMDVEVALPSPLSIMTQQEIEVPGVDPSELTLPVSPVESTSQDGLEAHESLQLPDTTPSSPISIIIPSQSTQEIAQAPELVSIQEEPEEEEAEEIQHLQQKQQQQQQEVEVEVEVEEEPQQRREAAIGNQEEEQQQSRAETPSDDDDMCISPLTTTTTVTIINRQSRDEFSRAFEVTSAEMIRKRDAEASEQFQKVFGGNDAATLFSSSMTDSEMGGLSRTSTRVTTPDMEIDTPIPRNNSSLTIPSIPSFDSLPPTPLEEHDDPLLPEKTFTHQLVFNKEGQVTGGTLPALVERLTLPDSTPDAMFVSTFYLTFRLFATPSEVVEALVDRFDYIGSSRRGSTPVRLRIYNVFKQWLESHWQKDTDSEALDAIREFATSKLKTILPGAGVRLEELTTKVTEVDGTIVPRGAVTLCKSKSAIGQEQVAKAPAPVISKSQLALLRVTAGGGAGPTILDFDPIELARQFTLKENRLFCSISTEELLGQEWTKKTGSKAVHVKAMTALSTDLAHLVAVTILHETDPKRRAIVIKHWIKIADRCLELANYDSLMAIMCSLNTSTIVRLKKTWELVSAKTKQALENLRAVIDVSKNYGVLRARLRNHVPPAIPFLGTYLTDLTFVDDGNPSQRPLSDDDSVAQVVNYDKYVKTTRIISELQRFQIPYNIQEVPEMQAWIDTQVNRVRASKFNDVQTLYRRSLLLEPREQTGRPTPINTKPEQGQTLAPTPAAPNTAEKTKDKFELFGWAQAIKDRSPSLPSLLQSN